VADGPLGSRGGRCCASNLTAKTARRLVRSIGAPRALPSGRRLLARASRITRSSSGISTASANDAHRSKECRAPRSRASFWVMQILEAEGTPRRPLALRSTGLTVRTLHGFDSHRLHFPDKHWPFGKASGNDCRRTQSSAGLQPSCSHSPGPRQPPRPPREPSSHSHRSNSLVSCPAKTGTAVRTTALGRLDHHPLPEQSGE
jgi:hypothetical protein